MKFEVRHFGHREALDEAPAQLSLSARLLHVLQLALKGEEANFRRSLQPDCLAN